MSVDDWLNAYSARNWAVIWLQACAFAAGYLLCLLRRRP